MTQRTFADLGVTGPLQRALRAENYAHPTPIQDQAIPQLLEGKDIHHALADELGAASSDKCDRRHDSCR